MKKILILAILFSTLIGLPASYAGNYTYTTSQSQSTKDADKIAEELTVILNSGKNMLQELQSSSPNYNRIYPQLCSNAAEIEKLISRVKQLENYAPKESVVNSLTETLGDMYFTIGRIEMETFNQYNKGRKSMNLALQNKPAVLPLIQDLAITAFNQKDYPKAEGYMDSLVDSREYISAKVYSQALILQKEVKTQLGK